MKNKIMALINIDTFYHDVRVIVGYYKGVHHSDHVIKELQRVADHRYNQLIELSKSDI